MAAAPMTPEYLDHLRLQAEEAHAMDRDAMRALITEVDRLRGAPHAASEPTFKYSLDEEAREAAKDNPAPEHSQEVLDGMSCPHSEPTCQPCLGERDLARAMKAQAEATA